MNTTSRQETQPSANPAATTPEPSRVRVAVLQGGPGSEREVSLRTGEAIAHALHEAGHPVVTVDVRDAGFVLPDDTTIAFIALHGVFGEDGGVQAELEARGIPYTGAGEASSRLAFDKARSKDAFTRANVPTPDSRLLDRSSEHPVPAKLPVVVKPPREGSSVGVHIVRTPADWENALADVFHMSREALVEDFIDGRELTVGILDDTPLPIVEIRPRDGFYNMENKYPWLGGGGGSDYLCPAPIDAATAARVQQAALHAHRALGIEVYSRVDVLLDPHNNPWVLEANTIPGMTTTSLLPKAAEASGLSFTNLCLTILNQSLALRATNTKTQP